MDKKQYQSLLEKAIQEGKKRKYQNALTLLLQITSETDQLPEAFLYLGRTYHALGQYNSAISMLRLFIKQVPESGVGHFFLGRSYLATDLPKNSLTHLKKAHISHPESLQTKVYIGIAYLKLKRPEIAVQYLQEAVEKDSKNDKIYKLYLNALLVKGIKAFHRGMYDQAWQLFIFLLEKSNDLILPAIYSGMIAYEKGDLKSALYYYERALQLSPQDELLLLKRAMILHQLNDYQASTDELNRFSQGVSGRDLDNLNGNYTLAMKHYDRKEYQKAIFHARQYIKSNGSDPDMHLLIGEAYRILNSFDKAKNHFLRVLDKDRSRIEARYGLVLTYWQTEEYTKVLEEVNRIERLEPDVWVSSYYRALCNWKLEKYSNNTLDDLRTQIDRLGVDPHLCTAVGDIYRNTGSLKEAESWYKQALDLNADFLPAMEGVLILYKKLGENDKLATILKTFISNKPNCIAIRKEYILILYEQQKYKLAAEEIIHYLQTNDDPKINRLLAICYRKIGKYKEALILYRQMLRSEPTKEEYLKALLFCLDKSGHRNKAIELCRNALNYLKQPTPALLLIYGVLLHRESREQESLEVFRNILAEYPKVWQAYLNIGIIYKNKGMYDFAEKYFQRAEKYKN